MAYVAMNDVINKVQYNALFLNGVCRHERGAHVDFKNKLFLNGVCRHERNLVNDFGIVMFLNGVCRHEQG